MFPWVSKSSFLAVALTAFTLYLLFCAYLLYFTERTELNVQTFAINSDCTRLTDVSGSSTNMWPPTHLTFSSLNSRTPLTNENAQSKWIQWWDDTQYRIHLDTTWPAALENSAHWSSCFSECRLTHAVDYSGTEFYLKADSSANVRLDHPSLSLTIYNFPGQSDPVLSLSFEYVENVLTATLTRDQSSSFFQPARNFASTILVNLKFYSNSFEVWLHIPSLEPSNDGIGVTTQTRAFYLTNYPFSGPYWIVVDEINSGSENEAYWTVQGTAQPPATQDYFWTRSSVLSMNAIYFESQSHCESEAPSICSSLTGNMDIHLTEGSYGEPTCYSQSGLTSHSVNNSMGSIDYSWTDMVWQGRDLNTGLGWDQLITDLQPRAHEDLYSNLASMFIPDDWYVCGYKSVPLWIDCLQDIRCVYEDESGEVRRMMFNYQISGAIIEFGEIPCIEKITDTQLFVRRTILDDEDESHNCIAPTTLATMDLFLELPGTMNKWWGCEVYDSVEECLSEPHRGEETCVRTLTDFPLSLEECEDSEYDCNVVTKFDGVISVSEYQQKYDIDISSNITGQAIFTFTNLYISPHDQCQLINEQLCDERFTSALCSKFAGAGPYLCNTDQDQDYLAAAMEAAGIAALLGWLVLFCILLYQTWCCCGRKDAMVEKKKALEKRKRDKKRKKREKKRQRAEEAMKKNEFHSGEGVKVMVEMVPPTALEVSKPHGSHDIKTHEEPFRRPVVNDPLQIQELEDLANGTLPLLYSDYSQQSYQHTRQPYSNQHEMYNINSFSPQVANDLAYEEFGDNDIPHYNNYYEDPDSLPSEYRTPDYVMGEPAFPGFGSIPVPHVRRSPLESRFLSDRSSTLTTTATNPELSAFYAQQARQRELEHELQGIDEDMPTMRIEVTEHGNGDDQSDPSSLSEFDHQNKLFMEEPVQKEPSKSSQPCPKRRPHPINVSLSLSAHYSWTEQSDDLNIDKLAPIPYETKLQDAIDNYDQSSSVVQKYSHSVSSARAAAKSPEQPPREREEPIEKLRRLFSSSSKSKSADRHDPPPAARRQSFDSPRKPRRPAITSFLRRHSIDHSPRARNFRPIPDSSPPRTVFSRLPSATYVQPHMRKPTPLNPIHRPHEPPAQRYPNPSDIDYVPPSIPRRRSEQTDQGMTSSFKTSSYMPSTPQDRDELSSLPDSEEGHTRKTTDSGRQRKISEPSHQVLYDPDPLPYNPLQQNNRSPALKTINETASPNKSRKSPEDLIPVSDRMGWWSRFENLKE